MTALLEMKQRLKDLYGNYEIYFQPLLKFVLALAYFFWINSAVGFSDKLESPFIVLILALICAILPTNAIVWIGYALIVGNCYSVDVLVAGFAALLILLMVILLLRFSTVSNLLMAFTPLGFAVKVPALVPIGGGLLRPAAAAIPAGCSVILYYFLALVKEQAMVLQNEETELIQKVKLLADGMMKNQDMWITVLAFVVTALLVHAIRTCSLDYAWRIAIVVGGVAYILVMLAGGLFLNAKIEILPVVLTTILSVILGIVLEFFAFGGDYTRTEHMEYEDDEYFYYVKAVPKVSIAASKRKIKKINAEPEAPEKQREEEDVVEYANPIFEDAWKKEEAARPLEEPIEGREAAEPAEELNTPDIDAVDFEKKLEESLKNL